MSTWVLMSQSKSFRFTGYTFKAAPPAGFARWHIHLTWTASGATCRVLATKPDFWPLIVGQLSLLNDLTLVHGILRSLCKKYHTSHPQASGEPSYINRHACFCPMWADASSTFHRVLSLFIRFYMMCYVILSTMGNFDITGAVGTEGMKIPQLRWFDECMHLLPFFVVFTVIFLWFLFLSGMTGHDDNFIHFGHSLNSHLTQVQVKNIQERASLNFFWK